MRTQKDDMLHVNILHRSKDAIFTRCATRVAAYGTSVIGATDTQPGGGSLHHGLLLSWRTGSLLALVSVRQVPYIFDYKTVFFTSELHASGGSSSYKRVRQAS